MLNKIRSVMQAIVYPWSLLGVVSWAIVAAGATWAVLSPHVRDVVLERIALSCIAVVSVSRAYCAYKTHTVAGELMVVAVVLAAYVVVLYLKHRRKVHTPVFADSR